MAVNAFIKFDNGTDGESFQKGMEKWIEIQGWDWEIDAETSWTKGGGASVGKPNPGKMNFEHYFDAASTTIMKFICTGKAFGAVTLKMFKTTGSATPECYFQMDMTGAFITKVAQNGTEEGNVTQKVEMVFKTVKIEYKQQDNNNGKLMAAKTFKWDIPAGTAE